MKLAKVGETRYNLDQLISFSIFDPKANELMKFNNQRGEGKPQVFRVIARFVGCDPLVIEGDDAKDFVRTLQAG